MTPHSRIAVRLILGALAAAIALGWAGSYMAGQAAIARAAASDLSQCMQLRQTIEQMRAAPAMARDQQVSQPQLTQQIETAVAAAGIPVANIERISPDAPRRLHDSPFDQMTIGLSLRNVRLQQVAATMYKLANDTPALDATTLRLTAPRDPADQHTWHAELVLSYLVYAQRPDTDTSRVIP
jgi:hypothetical protein